MHIPYKGMGPVLTDLLANEIQVAFGNPPNAVQHIQAGTLRAIAMAHPRRIGLMPDVPTLAEQGMPGFESNSWYVFFAAGSTPAPILDRLNSELVAVLKEPAIHDALTKQGVEIIAGTRAEATAFVAAEKRKYADAVRFSGAKVD